MQNAVNCQELAPFGSTEAAQAIIDANPDFGVFADGGLNGVGFYDICAAIGLEAAPDIEDMAVVSDLPVMVMNGEFDPITPPAFAERAAETLSNSYLYIYPGLGHGASIAEDCPTSMMAAFISDPTTAPDDGCIAEMTGVEFITPDTPTPEVTLVEQDVLTLSQPALVPADWVEAQPGTFARAQTGLDQTALIYLNLPIGGRDFLVTSLAAGFGSAPPELLEELSLSTGDWATYEVTVLGFPARLIVRTRDGAGDVVLLLSNDEATLQAVAEMTLVPIAESID